MTIPALSYLPFHVADIGDEEIAAVVETLRSGWLTTGDRTREFEAAFATAVGAQHAVAVNSCTAALHLALDALGIGERDEVVVPTMTFAASAEVVLYRGAKPVFADCDPHTLTLRAEDVERVFTSRTKAVMPVHYAGHPCDMDPILALAGERRIAIVDDAAHAFPASYRGRMIGSIADLTAFSFYATKTLTTGEGGMLTTDDKARADRARLMSLHGISRNAWNRYRADGFWRYEILEAGYKYNMTDIAAALGIVQLRRQRELAEARRRIVAAYDAGFADVPEVRTPARSGDIDHAWHLYVLRLELDRLRIDRDRFVEELRERGIGTSVHFIPLHLHPIYRSATYDLPHATKAFGEILSLPVYSVMTDADVARVIGAVADVARIYRR